MKVLIINFVYNWGSTGYICRDLKDQLAQRGVEVVIAAGFDWGKTKSGVFTFCTPFERSVFYKMNRLGITSKFDGSPIATRRLIRFIKTANPDIIHVHNINCQVCNMYKVLIFLGKNNYKTVITHHAEILYTGNCDHSYDCDGWVNDQCRHCDNKVWATGSKHGNTHLLWKRMEKTFSYFKKENVIFTTVSPWVKSRALQNTFLNSFRHQVVLNGVDTGVFYRRQEGREFIERKIHTNGEYALYVSAYFNPLNKNDIKGGYYITELAKMMPETNFVVVATSASNTETLPPNMHLWGKAKSQDELACLYSFAKMTVLTSKKETFSMICAESLCCGTPLVGFEAGGPESISLKEYSWFVEHGNLNALNEAIMQVAANNYDRDAISQVARERYSKALMAENYLSVYNNLLNPVKQDI